MFFWCRNISFPFILFNAFKTIGSPDNSNNDGSVDVDGGFDTKGSYDADGSDEQTDSVPNNFAE